MKGVFRRLFGPSILVGICAICCGDALAQIPTSIPTSVIPGSPVFGAPGAMPGQLMLGLPGGIPGQQILQPQPGQYSSGGQGTNPPSPGGQGVAPLQPIAPPSRLERLYTARLPLKASQNDNPTVGTTDDLTQFGYDIFGVPAQISSTQLGAPQDGYILGPGDEVDVVLRGPMDEQYSLPVNRDGQIILPKMAPIVAAGRTLAEFRTDVERRVARTFLDTNVYISVGQLRQVSVLVTGDVRAPGMRVLTALATPLDAILTAGGIAKTGSLRNVVLMRGNQSRTLDLYSIIADGNAVNLGFLENGDRIFVPALKDTVAIAGFVRHPGIFELQKGQSSISVDGLIQLAGGYEIGGAYRLSKVSLQPDGSTRIEPVENGAIVSDGEILLVNHASDLQTQSIRLLGAVKLPNAYPLSAASTVHQLLRSAADLTPDAYTAFAVIARRDMALNTENVVSFSVSRVLSGQEDVRLQNDDRVYIFKDSEIHDLAADAARQLEKSEVPQAPTSSSNPAGGSSTPDAASPGQPGGFVQGSDQTQLQTGQPSFGGGIPGVSIITPFAPVPGYQPGGATGGVPLFGGNAYASSLPGQPLPPSPNPLVAAAVDRTVGAISRETGQTNGKSPPKITSQGIADNIGVSPEVLSGTLGENLVWLFDEVKYPGPYLVARGTNLGEVVQMAGGPLRTADLTAVEVTSTNIDSASGTARTVRTDYKGTVDDFKRVALQPLDVIRFRPVFSDRQDGRVTIVGEVRYPGTFDVRRGERMSSVLARAGGLTDEAYALGAIFTRRSAAISESEANQRDAKELEVALAAAAQRGSFTSNVSGAGGAGAAGQTAADVVNKLITELRTQPALGRITVTADPGTLAVHPELDVAMEGGDTLYIPKRPSTITVTGEVLNTGSFTYRNDMSVKEYIAMAGGTRETADEGRTFVVLPDGTARPVEESWLSFNSNQIIPPGSTIVVPVAVAPFNFMATLTNITNLTSIVSTLAITAVSLKLLGQ
ncbi:MAG TPA: SLBB domain-containing protein [Micropepsaceae bacterium]|nr:SLBB domain-containing protein [Micropepsaceae bacterium]